MPVCHNKKLVFIHIPRTGGTSIRQTLDLPDYYSPSRFPSPQHLTLQELQVEALDSFSDYFKFTVIRNKSERLLSEFKWRLERKDLNYEFNKECPVKDMDDYPKFLEYVSEIRRRRDFVRPTYDHFRPQSDYLYGLDKIFTSLDEVEEHFGIKLRHLNKSCSV